MKKWMIAALPALALMVAACNDEGLDAITVADSNFETSTDGWAAGFAEFSSKTDSTSLARLSGRMSMPRGLDTTQHGFMIQSINRSDDMFSFLKKKITGLVPNGNYEVQLDISFATKYPENSVGAGGSPGSAVYLKAGAVTTEPAAKLDKDFYRFTLDKGVQSEAGKDAFLLGNIANGRTDTLYAIINRSTPVFPLKASAEGHIWLYVGTDSGFKGLTRLYYDRIRVKIAEVQTN